ncbi:hypothetical protein [uncultured Friedmanniella sp.]|uniref:hypothetical protein n=1 Tax=uncultured Friedmanniella sp. TaxID=335381 RepID=UPI0035CA9555
MTVELTVVVEASGQQSISGVVRSLDESTLELGRFELVLVDGGGDADRRASWDRLAARRPNVRIAESSTPRHDLYTGEYVLPLGADQRLFPDALVRMLDLAQAHRLDAVAGRQVSPGAPLDPSLLQEDGEVVGDPGRVLDGPVVLRRSSRLEPGGQDTGDLRAGVLSSYPATCVEPPAQVPATSAPVARRPRLSWDGPVLDIAVDVTLDDPDLGALRPVLLLRQLGSAVTFLLPTTGELATALGLTTWQTAGRLDVRTAAAGSPLPVAEYQVDVVLVGDATSTAAAALPQSDAEPALVGNVVVVTAAVDGRLQLDVGPGRHLPEAPVPPTATTIEESGSGCLLEVALPGWHVVEGQPLPARLALDRRQTPAKLVPRDGGVVLQGWVSGLAGAYDLSWRLGSMPLQPLGLSLRLAGDGTPSVVRQKPVEATPPPAPKPAPKKAGPKVAPKKAGPKAAGSKADRPAGPPAGKTPRPTGPVARLRRAVPSSWEPRVRRLGRNPALGAAYRRLTGLARGRRG